MSLDTFLAIVCLGGAVVIGAILLIAERRGRR